MELGAFFADRLEMLAIPIPTRPSRGILRAALSWAGRSIVLVSLAYPCTVVLDTSPVSHIHCKCITALTKSFCGSHRNAVGAIREI
jgi:hypothetical protein